MEEFNYYEIGDGIGGLKKIKVVNPWEKTSMEIYFHGAHLTSFVAEGKEMIFVSKSAVFSENSKIRGGIPVCFPQFADRGKLQLSHGFARASNNFIFTGCKVDKLKKEVKISLRLVDDPETRKIWENKFIMDISYTLFGKSLFTEISIINRNAKKNFDFTLALHTYFNVDDISKTKIGGLYGVKYIDKMRKDEVFSENMELLGIDKETDRIYMDVEKPVEVRGGDGKVQFSVDKDGFGDVVVWNPWIEKSKRMGDLGNEEYHKFLCVEIGQMGECMSLGAGQKWKGRMIITKN